MAFSIEEKLMITVTGAASSLGTAGCLVSGGLALLYVERRRKR